MQIFRYTSYLNSYGIFLRDYTVNTVCDHRNYRKSWGDEFRQIAPCMGGGRRHAARR